MLVVKNQIAKAGEKIYIFFFYFQGTNCHIYHEGKRKCSVREKVGWKVVSVCAGVQRCVGLTIKKGSLRRRHLTSLLDEASLRRSHLLALQVALVVNKPP